MRKIYEAKRCAWLVSYEVIAPNKTSRRAVAGCSSSFKAVVAVVAVDRQHTDKSGHDRWQAFCKCLSTSGNKWDKTSGGSLFLQINSHPSHPHFGQHVKLVGIQGDQRVILQLSLYKIRIMRHGHGLCDRVTYWIGEHPKLVLLLPVSETSGQTVQCHSPTIAAPSPLQSHEPCEWASDIRMGSARINMLGMCCIFIIVKFRFWIHQLNWRCLRSRSCIFIFDHPNALDFIFEFTWALRVGFPHFKFVQT